MAKYGQICGIRSEWWPPPPGAPPTVAPTLHAKILMTQSLHCIAPSLLYYNMFNQHANVQHIDLKEPLFGRSSISEDLKSILITVRYTISQFLFISPAHLQT